MGRPTRARGALVAALVVALASGCGDDDDGARPGPPPTSPSPIPSSEVPPPSSAPAVTDLVGLDDPPPVSDDVVAAGPLSDRVAPPHGCALATDAAQPVLEGASSADVLAANGAFLVAAYVSGGPDVVALARIAPGDAPTPLGRVPLEGSLDPERRTAPPVLAVVGDAVLGLAAYDASGGVQLVRFEAGTPAPSFGTVEVLASGADTRYPPALGRVDAGTLVAWTQASGTTAHVHVALVDAAGAISATHDVTPEAGSAAAPTFDAGGTLYFVDARAGISVVHRVTFGSDGAPAPATVAQPINLAAEPPSFAVVATNLGYAAVGNAATRAVGLVTLGSEDRARPLVPGLGYGSPLTLDGAPLGAAALFVTEAPSAADASAPHEVRARVVASDGALGDALVIPGATAPRVAVAGGFAAIVTRGAAVWWARCAE